MTGADLSLVTVGLSLTVRNGFPPLQREIKKRKEITTLHVWLFCLICPPLRRKIILLVVLGSLTREKELLHSHWQEKPVVRRREEKKRPLESEQKGGNTQPAPSSHRNFTPSLQLQRKVRVTGRVWSDSLISSRPTSVGQGAQRSFDTYLRTNGRVWNPAHLDNLATDALLFFLSHLRTIWSHPRARRCRRRKNLRYSPPGRLKCVSWKINLYRNFRWR